MGLQRRGRAGLNLSAAHIAELVLELAPLVEHARVREVHALPPADLLFVLERAGDGRILRMRLSADAEAARVHLQHERVESHHGPLGPFFRRVAGELAGSELAGLSQVRGDRLLLLEFRGTSTGERRALLAELVGRHSNLALLGRDDVLLELLVPPPAGKSAPRLVPGRPWVPPPGSGPRAAGAPLAQSLPDPGQEPPGAAGLAPLSWIVERALGERAARIRLESERRTLLERVERKLARARALLQGLELRRSASDESERVRQEGELLKANLARLARGMRQIVVEDFFVEGAPSRTIELDPRLGPQESLERSFERARKLERARAAVEGEIALATERIQSLEALEAEARISGDPVALDAAAVERGLLDGRQEADPRRRRSEPAPRLPYRSFVAASGAEVRVGRSAKDNDELSLRHSRGNDVWMHTADTPGSHVVLRLAGRAEPEQEDLLDAAHLAVHFSPLRGASRARVHVARCKEVHKPRGAKPGLVHLSGGRTWELRLQPARLQRLLGSRRPAPEDEDAGS